MEVNKKPVVDIEEIIDLYCEFPKNIHSINFSVGDVQEIAKECMFKALNHIITRIGEEIEVDYNFEGNRDENSLIEVYIKQGELERMKELLKQDLGI